MADSILYLKILKLKLNTIRYEIVKVLILIPLTKSLKLINFHALFPINRFLWFFKCILLLLLYFPSTCLFLWCNINVIDILSKFYYRVILLLLFYSCTNTNYDYYYNGNNNKIENDIYGKISNRFYKMLIK